MSHPELPAVLDRLDQEMEPALDRLFSLLRYPSISTDPAHAADCAAAAEWLTDELAAIGFASETRDTSGRPMVVAHGDALTAPGASGPSLLFYGHYDVQPVDPLELWDHNPFEPRIEDLGGGRRVIRARGAADDKGQLMTFVEACRAWKAVTGTLPANVSILLEGEEESGSPSLVPFLEANRKELGRDLALICDTGMWNRETPAITTMLRGLLGEEIVIRGADRDLHSGFYGGAAANPIRALARILGDLHDESGRVTLPGFYDGVHELSPEIEAQWRGLDFSAERFLGEVGLRLPAGEAGRDALHQVWARPTCEFNGIAGGYAGEGFKTVIPAQASAKVSCRLVGDQDPEAIREALRAHVRARLPGDCDVEFHPHGGARAVTMNTGAPEFEAARQALSEEWPNPAAFIGCGGSIPVAGHFQSILGMESLMVGFGLEDDRLHSPNEKYDLGSFRGGARSWARILAALA
ncbi:MAG: dipeptidase [Pseudomonadota bacterium]